MGVAWIFFNMSAYAVVASTLFTVVVLCQQLCQHAPIDVKWLIQMQHGQAFLQVWLSSDD